MGPEQEIITEETKSTDLYETPVKFYEWNGLRQIVDPSNREIFEIQFTSRDIAYEKKMYEKIKFLVDLMNGDILVNGDNGDNKEAPVRKEVIASEVVVKKRRGNPNFFKGMVSPMFSKKWKRHKK